MVLLRATGVGMVRRCKTSALNYYALRLHQPTPATLRLLRELLPDHIVSRYDVSLDLITATQADAAAVHELLRPILTMPWRGQRTTTSVEDTDYFAWQSWTTRNIVMNLYWAKQNHPPALHPYRVPLQIGRLLP